MRNRSGCRQRAGIVASLASAITASLLVAGSGAPAGAATDGSWAVTSTPSDVRAVHATLLRTGKVLLVAGSGNDRNDFNAGTFKTSIWDPATGNLTAVATPWDAFCSGHVALADGRILIAGGNGGYSSPSTNYQQIGRAHV